MSSSDAQSTDAPVELSARGGPGVLISVTDASYVPVAEGTNELRVPLSPGLYAVRFSLAGRTESRLVQLRSGNPVEIVREEGLSGAAETNSKLERAEKSLPVPRLEKKTKGWSLTSLHRSSRDTPDATVLLTGAEWDTLTAVSRTVDVVAVKSDRASLEVENVGSTVDRGDGTIKRYAVRPGGHSLRCVAGSRRKLEQTLHVFADRRVFVLLECAPFYELERHRDTYRRRGRFGVDPARTLIVSSALDQDNPDIQVLRLGRIIVHALRSPWRAFDFSLIDAVAQTDCPYLRIYLSALAIASFEHEIQDPGGDLPDRLAAFGGMAKFLNTIPAFLARWEGEDCADIAILLHEAQRLGLSAPADYPGTLGTPPMLDTCWRWAAARSIDDPEFVPTGGPFRAASTAREVAAPWLVWSRGYAQGEPAHDRTSRSEVQFLVNQLTEMLEAHGGAESVSTGILRPRARDFSRSTQQVLKALWALDDTGDQPVAAPALARLLGASAANLEDRLHEARKEIGSVQTS